MPHDYAATLPRELHEADDVLTKYGRWAVARGGSRTCGSAEGQYRPEGGEALEARRTPSAPLTARQRVAAQRALARTPDPFRGVLAALYVPTRPIGLSMRLLGIPPRLCQERHAVGLGIWWNLYRAQVDEPREIWQARAS